MSRYNPPDYRGPPRDRSRSPSRFSDRRPSTTSLFDNRPAPPPRAASDAPRGPRSQFDAPRPPPPGRLESSGGTRPPYSSLRDAPPLGSGDRGRPYRERDDFRRDRPPSRERSPARSVKDARDYNARDLDINRARRESRDGPLSAGSNYSDTQPPPSSQFRGGYRGRARGDFPFRGGRGGRSNLDDRDLLRRDRPERSPPPRWGARDRSREERDDRRFERREDERRPSDWSERERDRDGDRLRRDQGAPRLENRPSNESIGSVNAPYQPSQAPLINPERLALLEKSGADPTVRRSSVQLEPPLPREIRREPETPAYLNGRVESTAKRYESRDSSPPTQASVAVPAFSFLPPSAPSAPSVAPPRAKSPQEIKPPVSPSNAQQQPSSQLGEQIRPEPPADAPVAPKAQLASPPPAAPRAPRALDNEDAFSSTSRLQGSRSQESLSGPTTIPTGPANLRGDPIAPSMRPPPHSPAAVSALPTLIQPVSPRQPGKLSELGAPTGPRAARVSPRLSSVSPRPPFASPRSDAGVLQGGPGGVRTQTPPPSAPSGPRGRAYSVSPKAAPTAPKASRGPPLAPRGPERGPAGALGRAPDRLNAPQPWAPPAAPRAYPQWNQWRKPDAPAWENKSVPAKRDFAGEQKSFGDQPSQDGNSLKIKSEDGFRMTLDRSALSPGNRVGHEHTMDREPPRRQTSLMSGQDHGHSAKQSFFGKPVSEGEDDDNDDTGVSDIGQEPPSTSEDDDSDVEEGSLTLFNAKFDRQKRLLEAQLVDLSSRPYRATTPLESIARLARISAQDLQRITEQRAQEMEVDDSPVTHPVPLATHSSDSGESTELVTPRGDSHHRINIRGSDDSLEDLRRIRRASPEPVSLPYLVKDGRSLFHDSDAFQKRHAETTTDVLDAMEDAINGEWQLERDMEDDFANEYRRWREECEDFDRDREEQEKLERQQSIEPGPELDAPMAPPANPFEGRRLHKYSSEYDVEQVLKQSEETARIERERQEREQKKNQADMDKEAFVPDQLTEEEINRGVFVDFNRYRDPDSLTVIFSYEPPADDFTENEQQIFIAAFKETPKKWGEIASLLPGRTYEDCIRHYYANKWDGRFRDNRTKKLKAGGRRGRGGARGPRGRMGGLMGDLARAEDFLSPENMSEKGRPRRAAAPTTFAEKEAEAKANLGGPSPNKKPGPLSKSDANGEAGSDKPGKRQKRVGGAADKPGRKPKGAQQLPNLVSAPQGGAFGKEYMHNMGIKTDPARQTLEEAGLLAGLRTGHHGMNNSDGQVFYAHDGMVHPMPGADDSDRLKAGPQSQPPRQSASSYWSVPEQTDFHKYIKHFGRDFAAIAAHMGTKTQTMIKNHFQRQVDSGSKPELAIAANEADDRRARGEDLGPAPTPTPIVKRKYENPQAPPARSLAPHSEAMEVDDLAQNARAQPKHASPTQYQPRPQFTAPPHNVHIPATRVVPSPMAATAIPASTQLQAARPHQLTQGPRPPFHSDTRPESRQGLQPDTGFRAAQESPRRFQQPQSERTHVDARDPDAQYIRNLVQEQERALRMQKQYSQDRMEPPQRQNSGHRNPTQGSPLNQPLHHPLDRKPHPEDHPASPNRNHFPGFPRSSLGSSSFGPLGGPTPFTTYAGRSPFNASPTKREEHRPGSVPTGPPAQIPTAPHAEPPKRSNVLSLLNSEEEEPKPVKRDSLPSAPPRQASPISQTYPHSTSAPSIPGIRREPSFGQPSIPQSRFQGTPFGSQSSAPSSGHSSLKHEPGNVPVSQAPPQDWAVAARALTQTSQPPSATPTLERDVRQYYSHGHRSSLLGGLNQTRMVPSPPPLGSGIGHSRTPSLNAQSSQPGREQPRSSLAGPQQSSHNQPAQPLHTNPYASQQPPQFSQQSRESQNQAQHSHNSSLGGPFPNLHIRGMSRDDALHNLNIRERERQREREEQELMWQRQELQERERRREEEFRQQRQQEQERQRRAQPPALQPQHYGGPSFGQSRGLDLRAQARFDAENAMREQDDRQRDERRRQEALAAREREQEEFRRRQEDFRRTPLGGGFGLPPQQRR